MFNEKRCYQTWYCCVLKVEQTINLTLKKFLEYLTDIKRFINKKGAIKRTCSMDSATIEGLNPSNMSLTLRGKFCQYLHIYIYIYKLGYWGWVSINIL